MKALLLGGAGQLGQDILRANAASKNPIEMLAWTRAQLDVEDEAAMEAAIGGARFDLLINATGYHKTDEVERNAQRAFAVNAHAPARLARLCEERGALFVHFSTDYVFGGASDGRPFDEQSPRAPVNVYGASKAMGEDLIAMHSTRAWIVRVASLFGVSGARGKGGNFVDAILRNASTQPILRVVNDQVMSPTASADAARAVLHLLHSQAPPGVYHIVNDGGGVSWHAFAQEIFRQAQIDAHAVPISSVEMPGAARRPAYSVLDNHKLARAGFSMPDWREALTRYLREKRYLS